MKNIVLLSALCIALAGFTKPKPGNLYIKKVHKLLLIGKSASPLQKTINKFGNIVAEVTKCGCSK